MASNYTFSELSVTLVRLAADPQVSAAERTAIPDDTHWTRHRKITSFTQGHDSPCMLPSKMGSHASVDERTLDVCYSPWPGGSRAILVIVSHYPSCKRYETSHTFPPPPTFSLLLRDSNYSLSLKNL